MQVEVKGQGGEMVRGGAGAVRGAVRWRKLEASVKKGAIFGRNKASIV